MHHTYTVRTFIPGACTIQTADAFDTILTTVLIAALLLALSEGSATAMANLGFTLSESSQAALITHYNTTVIPGRAAGINTTTRTKLTTTLTEGVKAKESAEQLRLRAQQIFQEGHDSRAALIAETESVQAFDHANYESVRSSGLSLQEIQQVWLTERDTRVCEICLKMDFLAVPIDAPFQFPETRSSWN